MNVLKYTNILFDLDGTVTDPMQSIIDSAVYALSKFGISVDDPETLRCFIGPPLTESFKEFYGFDDEQALLGLKYYREHYSVHGLKGNRLYDGIADLFAALRQAGCRLILATSKPVEYAEKILELVGMRSCFEFIGGNDLKESRPTKQQVLQYIFENVQGLNAENTIMVGDRKYDVIGAHDFGLRCAAVLYGYGSLEELEACGADHIVKDPAELRKLLLDE